MRLVENGKWKMEDGRWKMEELVACVEEVSGVGCIRGGLLERGVFERWGEVSCEG